MRSILLDYIDKDFVPQDTRDKIVLFLGNLDVWISGDPVLGDPEISTTNILLDIFNKILTECINNPARISDYYETVVQPNLIIQKLENILTRLEDAFKI